MKIKYKIILGVLSTMILGSCVAVKFDTSPTSVPEEGGIEFTKMSNEGDNIIGPAIRNGVYINQQHRAVKTIYWSVGSIIAVSYDGEYIAFIALNNKLSNIYIKKTSGGSAVIQRTFRGSVSDVSFSPDSKNICFTDNTEGNYNVYMMNATEGSAIQQITSTKNDESGGVFSPGGGNIYYTKEEKYMKLIQRAGKDINQMTTRYTICGYNKQTALNTQYSEGCTPCPLPDGERLLVTKINKESGNGEIWTYNLKTGLETNIIAQPDRSFSSPDISPDGTTIVMEGITHKSKTNPENLNIFTVRLDGTRLTQLTFHPALDVSPKWSDDGRDIYFISGRGSKIEKYAIWKMNYKKDIN